LDVIAYKWQYLNKCKYKLSGMLDEIKEHIFFVRFNIGEVVFKLKKIIKIKFMGGIPDFNTLLSSSNVEINSLNNPEDHYYYNLKRLYRQYQI
jgi:hypothetical protein